MATSCIVVAAAIEYFVMPYFCLSPVSLLGSVHRSNTAVIFQVFFRVGSLDVILGCLQPPLQHLSFLSSGLLWCLMSQYIKNLATIKSFGCCGVVID